VKRLSPGAQRIGATRTGIGDWGGDFGTRLLTYLARSAETQDRRLEGLDAEPKANFNCRNQALTLRTPVNECNGDFSPIDIWSCTG